MARVGARDGPAGIVDYLGMVAGILAPAILAGYVTVAAAYINAAPDARGVGGESYSHIGDTMSNLGDRGDSLGTWFVVVNLVIAALLVLYTLAVYRRVPVGKLAVVLLAVAALATAGIAAAPCTRGCPDPGPLDSELSRHLGTAAVHYLLAVVTIVVIVALPWTASKELPDSGPYGWLKPTSRWIFQLVVLAVALLLISGVVDAGGAAERALWALGYAWIVLVAVAMFLQRRGRIARRFDVARLQENVVYGRRSASHGILIVATVRDPAGFRSQLASALAARTVRPELPRPRPRLAPTRPFAITIGFTHRGLQRLHVPYRWTATTDDAFASGMDQRAPVLGDVGASDPGRWEAGWRRRDLHVLIWIAADSRSARTDAEQRLGPLAATLDERIRQPMRVRGDPRHPREPFGFADGVSQPWIEQIHPGSDEERFGGGKLERGRRGLHWAPLAIGEFVLGEIDESGDVAPVPEPRRVFDGASFLVVRKLEQSVGAFQKWTNEVAAERGDLTPEEVGARLVGRHVDGTPLATPSTPDSRRRNDFTFGLDPEGFECPVAAHVRRANPRDALGFDGVPAHRRRLIRRGMPYRDVDATGLVFMGLNARIEGQFEFVQSQWLNDGNPFRVGTGPDPIAGSWTGDRQVVIHDEVAPIVASVQRPFVTTRGGEYFVVPSIDGLRALTE